MTRSFKTPIAAAQLLLLCVCGLTPAAQRWSFFCYLLKALGFLVLYIIACLVVSALPIAWKDFTAIEGIPYIDGDLIDGRIDMQRACNGKYDLHSVMLALHKEKGPVLQTFWRGQHVLLVNHPKLVYQVFKEAPNKIPLNMPLDTILHLAKDDGRGERFKKAIKPSLNLFKDEGRHKILLDRLCSVYDEHARNGTSFDPMEINGSFALDFLYGVLLNLDKNFMRINFRVFEELRESAEFIFDNMEQTLPSLLRPTSWLDFLLDLPALTIDKLLRRFDCWQLLQDHCKALLVELRKIHLEKVADFHRRIKDLEEAVKQATDEITKKKAEDEVEKAKRAKNKYETLFVPVFLNYAAQAGWKDKAMVRELAIFVLAGFETTASAMSWLMFEMARNDGVQEKCREVVDGLNQSPPVPDSTNYLKRVIKESMRINPVVSRPMLRVSDHDIVMVLPPVETVDNALNEENKKITVRIPKGTGILVNIYALHNSEANWANPTVFDPDRFDWDVHKNPNSEEEIRFAPFFFGGRECPGQRIAMEEMQMVLEVLTKYHFSFEDANMKTQDRRELQRSSITMRPVDGLRMRVTKPAAPAPIAPIDN